MTKGVSVIVCCYNSSDRLPQTIKHLARQKTNGQFLWEIVLVDNASNDSTTKVASEEWELNKSPVPMKIVSESMPGLSNARSRGIREASFEYLLFCDDDNWLSETYVTFVYDILSEHGTIGVLGGRNDAVSDIDIPFWFSSYQFFYAVGCQALESGEVKERNFVFGAGMAFRKTVYDKLMKCGFQHLVSDRQGASLTSGGDIELCYIHKILGYKIWYDERLVLKHYMPGSRLTKEYLKRLEAGAIQGLNLLQVYDPYLQSFHKRSWLRLPLFFYFLLRHIIASSRNGKNEMYFLTYLEACNVLPFHFSVRSKMLKHTIQKFSLLV